MNCFASISDLFVRLIRFLNSNFSISQNFIWIFSARITTLANLGDDTIVQKCFPCLESAQRNLNNDRAYDCGG